MPLTQMIMADDLIAVIQVINSVENGVGVGDFNNGTVWKDKLHAGLKHLPFNSAMQVVSHEKPAA